MNNSLLVGKLINAVLLDDANITAVAADRIWPLGTPREVAFPYIIFTRSNDYASSYTKDGSYSDSIDFQISTFADKYFDGVELANYIRAAFENHNIDFTDNGQTISITNVRMTGASEMYVDDTFIQSLTFTCNAE